MQGLRATLTKPFKLVKEGEEYKPAILAFGYRPAEISDEEGVLSYDCLVYLNLWLVEFTFEFNFKPLKRGVENG